jgi:hypothetical protein
MWERSDVLVTFANSFRQADPFASTLSLLSLAESGQEKNRFCHK